jgi:diphthine synthase
MGKLIFIGLGLYDAKDISLKGLEALKGSDSIFAEFYTAIMQGSTIQNLEEMLDKPIKTLTREQIEDGNEIITLAKHEQVAFICQGDPLTATTHIDLLLSAKKENIETNVIHGISITSSVPGLLGLQFYKFGRTTTLAYPEGDYYPESPYDVIVENLERGLHTLVLLDIHAKEKRYMSANEGIQILLEIDSKRENKIFDENMIICVVARAGAKDTQVFADQANKLLDLDFHGPLHTLVVPGKLHFKEAEALIALANAPKSILKST